tara:strand:- start:1387 stop:1572 length:186 start_codon:yes stop_codon:yes gene_type:complete
MFRVTVTRLSDNAALALFLSLSIAFSSPIAFLYQALTYRVLKRDSVHLSPPLCGIFIGDIP